MAYWADWITLTLSKSHSVPSPLSLLFLFPAHTSSLPLLTQTLTYTFICYHTLVCCTHLSGCCLIACGSAVCQCCNQRTWNLSVYPFSSRRGRCVSQQLCWSQAHKVSFTQVLQPALSITLLSFTVISSHAIPSYLLYMFFFKMHYIPVIPL